MNLSKKKELAARTLKVGKGRIVFVKERLDEVKEAITKQDIRDLKKDGAILVKNIQGRKKVNTRTNRSPGNVRKKVNTRKQDYVKMTRKLRGYTKEMNSLGKVSDEEVKEIRKKIRNRQFKSKANLKEYIGGLKK
jgi:large subunit ribosomal protein L19e